MTQNRLPSGSSSTTKSCGSSGIGPVLDATGAEAQQSLDLAAWSLA